MIHKCALYDDETLWHWFLQYLFNNSETPPLNLQHETDSVSDSQRNDCNESVLFTESKTYKASIVDRFLNERLSGAGYFSVNEKHKVKPELSDFWINHSNELVLFTESKTYRATSLVWFLNERLLWDGSFQWIKKYSKTGRFQNDWLWWISSFYWIKNIVQPV